MPILVQKFGGTSVADAERLRNAAQRAMAAQAAGYDTVVVVSAQGDTTDELLEKAAELHPHPPARELDTLLATGEQQSMALLAIAIDALGGRAVSLSGQQVGIRTSNVHGKAKITGIDGERIRRELAEGRIVVVAGFQGVDDQADVTTLGRGGSDTTAVALAAALGAEACEIYTDVDGVYSADPRIAPKARKMKEISFDEMLELASLGAKVLHLRSVEVAKKFGIPIHVRSSFVPDPGTIVKEERPMEGQLVVGVAHDTHLAKLTILGVPDRPGVAAALFGALAEAEVNVDMIVQSASREGINDISFTVAKEDERRAHEVAQALVERLAARGALHEGGVAKVSIVGAGMISYPGVAAKMFQVIGEQGANIAMISTSDISISCVIPEERVADVVRALHTAFGLDRED